MTQAIADFLSAHGQMVIFAGLSVLTLLSALFVVTAKRVTHACISLLPCFVGIAGIYALLGSSVMLAFQLLIYAGGIMVLLLFAIFLLERRTGPIHSAHHIVVPALLIAGITCVIMLLAIKQTKADFNSHLAHFDQPPRELEGGEGGSPWYAYTFEPSEDGQSIVATPVTDANVRRTGLYFLTYYILPFELTSLILVVAMVGAIIMARREKGWVAAGKIPGPTDEDEGEEESG